MIKNSFIKIENDNSMLNLENVTNIAFLDKSNRIIFNFVNNIEIKTEKGIQVIADYRYDDHNTKDLYDKKKEFIINKIKEIGFIEPLFPEQGHRWVNSNLITFVNVDYKNNRLMLNLANSVTKPVAGEVMLVNDFVFWNHKTSQELESSIKHIFDTLS